MWILIDNYDSFTYILLHYLQQTGNECKVFRNDEITISRLKQLNPERIIISPGPETPLQAGITMEVIQHFHQDTPILGVCLGHQAMGMFFGGKLIHIPYPMHGKTSEIIHNNHELYTDVPSPSNVMRYHSLAITDIEGTGLQPLSYTTDDNILMSVAHNEYPCIGIQYHPESIGTNYGQQLINNWAKMYH